MKNFNKQDLTINTNTMRELTADEIGQVAGGYTDQDSITHSATCPAGTTAPTAPTGPSGPTGPTGPTGFTGPGGSEPTGGSTDNTTVGETIID